jgi:hypothetical protein
VDVNASLVIGPLRASLPGELQIIPVTALMENYISVGIEVVFADMLNTLRPGP